MNQEVLFFFNDRMDALPLYERFEELVRGEIGEVTIKVQKTQISFYNRHLFACVSFARVRKKKLCPDSYLVITFGLNRKLASPRIDIATEPYPNRWTHHILISEPAEMDEEFMGWIKEASDFAAGK